MFEVTGESVKITYLEGYPRTVTRQYELNPPVKRYVNFELNKVPPGISMIKLFGLAGDANATAQRYSNKYEKTQGYRLLGSIGLNPKQFKTLAKVKKIEFTGPLKHGFDSIELQNKYSFRLPVYLINPMKWDKEVQKRFGNKFLKNEELTLVNDIYGNCLDSLDNIPNLILFPPYRSFNKQLLVKYDSLGI